MIKTNKRSVFSCPVCKQGYNLSNSELSALPLNCRCEECGAELLLVKNNENSIHSKLLKLNTTEMADYLGTSNGLNLCCGEHNGKKYRTYTECLNCWIKFLQKDA